jgi:hypothetical protein
LSCVTSGKCYARRETIFPLATHGSGLELKRRVAGERLFSREAQMADHTYHELTRHTFRRTELGSVNADFCHRADGTSSFLCTLLNSRGEERFTPVLQGTLHGSLHRSAVGKAGQVNTIDASETVGLRAGWHDVRAGATPPFDARCVTVAAWSLPPSQKTSCPRFAWSHTQT